MAQRPPFEINNKMLSYVATIMEKIGYITNYNDLNSKPFLRRNNRLKSIHSSLAIEANSLSLNQVRDVINGKFVLGNSNEIQEVKNAYNAYEELGKFNPYDINELKRLHGIMTHLTVDESGQFRSGEEGVFSGDVCVFVCPPQRLIPSLMDDLFLFINANKDVHPLIISSVFHYEFVFIHPFSDGNGRMARLWQNALLTEYKEIFKYVPIESFIFQYQQAYYDAISLSHKEGNSNHFIEFMLLMIDKTLEELVNLTKDNKNFLSLQVEKLLSVMEFGVPLTSSEIMAKLHLKSKETFRKNYLDPAIDHGLIGLMIPDKPTSKNQRYIKK